jgi:hypothetical protein
LEPVFAAKIGTGEFGSEAALIARRRLESGLGRRDIVMPTVGYGRNRYRAKSRPKPRAELDSV